MPERIPARQERWLRAELERWRADGLVDAAAAESIAARYEAGGGTTRVLVGIGASLLGIGVLWLIAANLDVESIGPTGRIAGVVVLWLAFVVAAELAAARDRRDVSRFDVGERREIETRPGVGVLRVVAVLLGGGVVFQAAQSLQVPAYEPALLLAWAAGAFAYAYATQSAAAVTVAIGAGASWYVWALAERVDSGPAFVLGLAVVVPIAAAAAVAHERSAMTSRFAAPYRVLAALLALVALFAAAVPEVARGGIEADAALVAGLALAFAATLAAAVAAGGRTARTELAGAAAVTVAAFVLMLVAPGDLPDTGGEDADGAAVAYVLLASVVFIAAAAGVAVAGAAREAPALTNVAFGALMLFVALQSFGLLASLLSGALVAILAGAILVAAGLGLDRARRRLLSEAEQT